MKKILLALPLLLLLSFSSFAQFNENYEPDDPQKKLMVRKVAQYHKLKQTGFRLLGGGVLVTLIGSAMIASADWEQDMYGSWYTNDPTGPWGLLGVVYAGVPLIATGTTLSIIGNAKEKSYLRKLDNLNASYINHNGAHGLRLVYNF